MRFLLLLFILMLFWSCSDRHDPNTSSTTAAFAKKATISIIDSLIIPINDQVNWIATTENGQRAVLYSPNSSLISLYDLTTQQILRTHKFNTAPFFDKFRAACFIGDTPYIITTRHIYSWEQSELKNISLNTFYDDFDIALLETEAACLISQNDTSFIFSMSQNRPFYTPSTRNIDSIQYAGEFLSMRRLSRDTLEHIGHVPTSSDLLSPGVLREPVYNVIAHALIWESQLGVVFSPENRIHFYSIDEKSSQHSHSLDIPIPNYQIINRHLDKVEDRNLRLILEASIVDVHYTTEKLLVNYTYAFSDDILLENKLYNSSLFSLDFDQYFSLTEIFTIIYNKSTDEWLYAQTPDNITTIGGILPGNKYIANVNNQAIELASGQFFYIVTIE